MLMASTCLVLVLLVLSDVVAAERLNDHFESQQEVAEGSWFDLNWTRPETPRLDAISSAPSSMIQSESPPSCDDARWTAGFKTLGKGAYGSVYTVQDNKRSLMMSGKKQRFYAAKIPSKGGEEEARREIEVLTKTKELNCLHVLKLVEKDPCMKISGEGYLVKDSFVVDLLPSDLQQIRRSIPATCFRPVFDAIRSGLDCLHKAGYIHGDLKPDNVLFEATDDDGCPTGIQLADFGLSKKIGEFTPKCPFQFYLRCYHEPATMFEQVPDMFNVSAWKPYGGRMKWHFQADPRLDECSFALLMYNLFGERVPEIQEELGGRGACGPMGPKRLLEMP